MAFDTAFNITWNQRVHKEETAFLKFLDKQKAGKAPPAIVDSDRRTKPGRAMSDADLMSAIRSERDSNVGSVVSKSKGLRRRGAASESDLNRGGRSRGSSMLQGAGSSISSPSSAVGRGKKAPPMTFEQMQDHVSNQSMNTYIKDLEKDAKEAQVHNDWAKQKIKDGLQQEVDEKSKARRLAEENGRVVQQQIEENKGRRANTRKSFVEAASAHNFPLFTETFISQDEVDQYRKDVKVNFREELDEQHKMTQVLKNILVKKDRIYAAEKREANIKKMQDDHAFDHVEKIRKGNEMTKVWDRDVRLKNIKNAILSGKDATGMVESS